MVDVTNLFGSNLEVFNNVIGYCGSNRNRNALQELYVGASARTPVHSDGHNPTSDSRYSYSVLLHLDSNLSYNPTVIEALGLQWFGGELYLPEFNAVMDFPAAQPYALQNNRYLHCNLPLYIKFGLDYLRGGSSLYRLALNICLHWGCGYDTLEYYARHPIIRSPLYTAKSTERPTARISLIYYLA